MLPPAPPEAITGPAGAGFSSPPWLSRSVLRRTASADQWSTHDTLDEHKKATNHGAHVAVDGNSDELITEDEKTCLVQVIASWCRQLGWTQADVLGTATRPSRIQGHRYVGLHISATKYVTACPGEALTAFLPELRRRVAAYLPA
jgi:hypothetical protein